MNLRLLLTAAAATFAATLSTQAQESFAADLEKLRAEHKLPALGAIAIVDGEIQEPTVVGMRKFEGNETVTPDDKWHIGSCTKSMTATLAATFVEAGDIQWETTVGDVFGDDIEIPDDAKEITLHMLITNRSGIPGAPLPKVWANAWKTNQKSGILKRRLDYTESVLNQPLDFPAGSKYAYSNSGFVVAGAMLEKISGKSWEDLMEERIFKPLGMDSAGFGSTTRPGKEDQPWGHHAPDIPQEPGPRADNPDVLGPAGTVHVSLPGLAKYVRMHALLETGKVIKKAETFKFLHSIPAEVESNYGCGWLVLERPWANGKAMTHNGSNTMNFCVIWMAPERKFAAIATSNIGTKFASKAADSAVGALITSKLK